VTPDEVATTVRTLRPMCVRWARRYVGASEAEDVAQAALLALVQKGHTVEVHAAAAWLRTAVFYKGRSHGRGRREVLDGDLEIAADGDPEATLASAELSAEVTRALATVDDQRRAIVYPVLAEGRPLAEVARELAVPHETARVRLRDGTADLRGVLERRRVTERRKSRGSTSWGVLIAWWSGLWRRTRDAAVEWGPVALGLAATLAVEEPVTVAPVADELPARTFEVAPLRFATALPPSERGAHEAPVRPDRSATAVSVTDRSPRRTHDAPARMLRERVEQQSRR